MSPGTVRPLGYRYKGACTLWQLLLQKPYWVLTETIRENPENAFSWCWAVKTGKGHEPRNPRNEALEARKGQEADCPLEPREMSWPSQYLDFNALKLTSDF